MLIFLWLYLFKKKLMFIGQFPSMKTSEKIKLLIPIWTKNTFELHLITQT